MSFRQLDIPELAGAIVPTQAQDLRAIEQLLRRELEARSENTRITYLAAWRAWRDFCVEHQRPVAPIDVELLRAFLEKQSQTHALSTVRVQLAAIGALHGMLGGTIPLTRAHAIYTWLKAAEKREHKPPRVAPALTLEDLRAIVRMLQQDPSESARRDHALLLVGVLGAFRRAELSALNVQDLEEDGRGLRIWLARSKTDQAGKGRYKVIFPQADADLCAIDAVRAWLAVYPILLEEHRPLFPSLRGAKWGERMAPAAINEAIKRRALAANVVATAHSVRRTFATLADLRGAEERDVMRHAGWRSRSTVDRYTEHNHLYTKNPTRGLFVKE